jgi:hypothetical protein
MYYISAQPVEKLPVEFLRECMSLTASGFPFSEKQVKRENEL